MFIVNHFYTYLVENYFQAPTSLQNLGRREFRDRRDCSPQLERSHVMLTVNNSNGYNQSFKITF